MDAKFGDLRGVLYSPVCIRLGRVLQWQHHQNHSDRKGTGTERRWCRTSRARFKQWKSVLGSSVLTLQSINTPFCFSFSLSSSHSLLSLCQQRADKWVQNTIWLHPSMCASPINDVYSLLGLPITTILSLFTLNLPLHHIPPHIICHAWCQAISIRMEVHISHWAWLIGLGGACLWLCLMHIAIPASKGYSLQQVLCVP